MGLLNKRFIVIMSGYTAVGKSTVAKKISKIPNTEIFHSAVIRKELGLTPKNKEDADKFFDYRNNLREEVDKKVYRKLAENAKIVLEKGKNVVLDAGYFFKWQRQLVYDLTKNLNPEIIILRVTCNDEDEIKRRLEERANKFEDSPLNETPSWNTYIATKLVTESLEGDSISKDISPIILEYDTLSKKAEIIQGDESSENVKNILNHLKSEGKIFAQDSSFKFFETDKENISRIIKNKIVIALDFDGVITNPHKIKAEYLKKINPHITEEKTSRKACLESGMKKEEYEKESIRAYTESPEKLPLEEGFIENFLKIRNKANIAIFILTSRYNEMLKHLEEYLKYHKIKIDGVINTQSENKLIGLKEINAKIFVEDVPSKLREILEKDNKILNECLFVLYRNVSNRKDKKPHEKIIEVKNWGELLKVIEKHLEYINL